MAEKLKMFIDGEWAAAKSGATLPVINPSNGELLAEVPACGREDVDRAVQAARRAFDEGPWKDTTAQDRGKLLFKMAGLVRDHAKELAETDTRNMGKPIVEAEFDVNDAANCFEYYGGLATKIHGETLSVPDNALSMVVREPVGVVGQIIPWNYPLLMAVWKTAPALAAGCTVILKPAEQSPLSALRLAKLFEMAGVPRGVVNVITGDGMGAGQPLVAHPGVDKVAFTGGTDAGRAVLKTAADTIKRTTMELGGKNPNIVFDDADFEAAVDGALFGAFANQGEVCSAGSRLLVQKGIYDRLVAELRNRVKRVRVGDPMKRETKMGPLVTKEHRDRVLSYIEIGKKEAKLLCGGGVPAEMSKGWFVEPTIFVDVDHNARISREEIFGPVLSVIRFDTEADAVRMANDTPYGLAGGVWTRDVFKGIRVMKALRAGILWLNTYHPTYNEAPWGGYKQSGFGRELGLYGIEAYLEVKQMNVNLREEPLGWY
jgi:betaine-aldehyde dehydrogenase